MKSKGLWLAISFLVTLSLLAAGCAAPAPEHWVIKAAHSMPTTNIRHISMEKFAELCNEYTNGQVEVEIHPAASLYGDKDTLEAVTIGAIQMAWQPTSQLAVIDSSFPLLSCPGIYGTKDEIYNLQRSPELKEMGKRLEAKGVHYIGEGNLSISRVFINKVRPGPMPEDWKGLKIRVSASLSDKTMTETIGAGAVVMEFAEVPTALMRGAVDGLFTSLATAVSKKLYELATYCTAGPQYGPSPFEVLINKEFWDSLPKDIQDTIENKVWPETLASNQELMDKMEQEAQEAWATNGQMVYIDTPELITAWVKALEPARDFLLDKAPADALPLIQKGMKYTAWRK